MNLCKDNYLNLAEGENLIPYKCIFPINAYTQMKIKW